MEEQAPPPSAPPFQLLGSLRRIAETLLGTLQNRIELFAVELQEEKTWLIATLLWAAACVFFCGLAIVFTVGAIVYLVPEPARGWVLIGVSLLFIALAVRTVVGLRRSLQEKPPPLADTVGEPKKDLNWIQSQD
jgi:uncharacterized membrane protein YqjE